MQYEKEIRGILCEVFENPEYEAVDPRADLAPHGLDSINCMNLVITLEGAFDIEIPEDKLGMRFVRNVYDICRLVEEVKDNGCIQHS